jgi:uncharacterized protein YndB with AHSA1/START domain
MSTYDWSCFKKRISIKASVQDIYNALSTEDGLEKWFLRKALFTNPDNSRLDSKQHIEKGTTYEWWWHGYSDAAAELGTILEANGKNYLRFVFGKAGTVSILIKEEKSEVVTELVQEDIPEDDESRVNFHLQCSAGWVFYLANLKSILEGGIDLRNKNNELTNVINS